MKRSFLPLTLTLAAALFAVGFSARSVHAGSTAKMALTEPGTDPTEPPVCPPIKPVCHQ